MALITSSCQNFYFMIMIMTTLIRFSDLYPDCEVNRENHGDSYFLVIIMFIVCKFSRSLITCIRIYY